jgi:hypothetical protein
MEDYIRTRRKLYRKRMPASMDVPDKSETFKIRCCHVHSKLKGDAIFLKLAHKSGTVLRVVEIPSHKRPFNLLRRAR